MGTSDYHVMGSNAIPSLFWFGWIGFLQGVGLHKKYGDCIKHAYKYMMVYL